MSPPLELAKELYEGVSKPLLEPYEDLDLKLCVISDAISGLGTNVYGVNATDSVHKTTN